MNVKDADPINPSFAVSAELLVIPRVTVTELNKLIKRLNKMTYTSVRLLMGLSKLLIKENSKR